MNSYTVAGIIFIIGIFITLLVMLLLNVINNKRTQKNKEKENTYDDKRRV